MRLTPDVVEEADQGLNCLGDRELVLRGHAIPVIENLALARDSFDTIDLSDNIISILADGFPPFPRLSTLYLARNRIERIGRGVADSLPNLTTLILTANRICSPEDLNFPELARLKKLEILSIIDNPVASSKGIREMVIKNLPSVKVFNFSKISAPERVALGLSATPGTNQQKEKHVKRSRKRTREGVSGSDEVKTFDVGNLGESSEEITRPAKRRATKSRALTVEESLAVKSFIENASVVEDVVRIQEAIRNGTVREFLSTHSKDAVQLPPKDVT